jgi:hypothetical protein
MFPFRPSRAATALLELAEAVLAPDAFEHAVDEGVETVGAADREPRMPPHLRRSVAPADRRRRPAPPRVEGACLTPLTRAGRARDASRRTAASNRP